MKLVSKRVERYDHPVPVYDVTNLDGNHNFVLANGLVLHNCMKDPKGKAAESDEIINILAAVGFDMKAPDPYSKLTVGKIICLADPDPDGPFVGDTKIRCRSLDDGDLGNEPHDTDIKNLVGRKFEVPVFHGGKEIWAPATAELVKNVDQIVAIEIGKTKYKVDLDHKFLCIRTDAMYGRYVTEHTEDLVFVRALDLRVGDRVYMPSANNTRDRASCDYKTKLGYAPVSKLRVQKLNQPVPVYCLTVPRYHHFVLPSGIVSSNCHINSLLLALFYRHLPELFNRGLIYVADSPEFYAIHKQSLVTGMTLSEVQKKLAKMKAPASTPINHVKGYGELDASLMRVFAMDPSTRRLIKIGAVEEDDKVEFVRLMNEDVQFRREVFGLPVNAKGEEEEAEAPATRGRGAGRQTTKRVSAARTNDALDKKTRRKVKATNGRRLKEAE